MKNVMVLSLLLARVAFAMPATVTSYGCGVADLAGNCLCPARLVVTQPDGPEATFGHGPWNFHCEGQMDDPPARTFRYVGHCGVGAILGRVMAIITPDGHVMLDCHVVLP